MSKEEVMKLAREAGIHVYPEFEASFERFAALVAAADRSTFNFCPRCGKRTKDIHTCTPPAFMG